MSIQSIGDLLVALRAKESGKLGQEIYVSNDIRKKFLIEHGNRFISRATVHELDWVSVGSGVWIPSIINSKPRGQNE